MQEVGDLLGTAWSKQEDMQEGCSKLKQLVRSWTVGLEACPLGSAGKGTSNWIWPALVGHHAWVSTGEKTSTSAWVSRLRAWREGGLA